MLVIAAVAFIYTLVTLLSLYFTELEPNEDLLIFTKSIAGIFVGVWFLTMFLLLSKIKPRNPTK